MVSLLHRATILNRVKLKAVSGKVIVDEKQIKGAWKEYMEKTDEWDRGI